ncbi:MAG: hypothetical protein RLZZ436_310 [Planctomycetota bacterium]
MIVLDTDHLSCLEWGSEESSRLRERLADVPEGSVAVSIISYEEQMRGWLSHLAQNKRWIDRLAYMGNYAGICRPIVRFPLPTSHWMQPIALKICAANACE